MLTVKSRPDPHMIIELEDGLKLWLWLCLPYSYGVSLTFMLNLWVGIQLYLCNQVLLKFDQLKFLNAVKLSTFPCQAFAFILSPHLRSTTSAHPCYKQCCSEEEDVMKSL
jgi:hypothetical protein